MSRTKGHIKLNRRFFENFLWSEARTFSKAEAWIDLIQSARFEASTELINGKVIELQRGELAASRRFLELRWNWGSSKVSNFLKILADLGMINQRQVNGQTVISLVKYGIYNDKQTTNEPQTEPTANHWQTTGKPLANQNKEYKEREELEEFKNQEKNTCTDSEIYDSDFSDKQPEEEKEKSSAKKEKENQELRESEFFEKVCDFFSQTSREQKDRVFGDMIRIRGQGDFEAFQKQTEAYMDYKSMADEKHHSWNNYPYQWRTENWIDKLEKMKSKNGKSNSKNGQFNSGRSSGLASFDTAGAMEQLAKDIESGRQRGSYRNLPG